MRFFAGNGSYQRGAVGFAFQHRQAVVVRAHAADQQIVAVKQQVLRGNGGGHIIARFAYQACGIGGGDVLEHHF